jgi:FkbM family methyltransferase
MNVREMLRIRFRKRLPREFGGGKVIVTGRSDARVLRPGWRACAHDLMLVTRNLVTPGMCVWDLGANLGIFSAMAAFRAGPEGAVFALEANPYYADLVDRTARDLPHTYAPITVLCAAIAEARTVMNFGVSAKGHARSSLLGLAEDEEPPARLASVKQVVTVTGDDLLAAWKAPGFVKMDVEGAELLALRGSTALLRDVRPIFYLEVSKPNQRVVSDLLRGHGYALFHLRGDGSEAPVDICSFYTIARPNERSEAAPASD